MLIAICSNRIYIYSDACQHAYLNFSLFMPNVFLFLNTEVSLNFKMLFLEEANKYRRMHSGVPLIWSYSLMTKAQKWAEYLVKEKK